jgi:hypothetical protein
LEALVAGCRFSTVLRVTVAKRSATDSITVATPSASSAIPSTAAAAAAKPLTLCHTIGLNRVDTGSAIGLLETECIVHNLGIGGDANVLTRHVALGAHQTVYIQTSGIGKLAAGLQTTAQDGRPGTRRIEAGLAGGCTVAVVGWYLGRRTRVDGTRAGKIAHHAGTTHTTKRARRWKPETRRRAIRQGNGEARVTVGGIEARVAGDLFGIGISTCFGRRRRGKRGGIVASHIGNHAAPWKTRGRGPTTLQLDAVLTIRDAFAGRRWKRRADLGRCRR